jgi:glc operon protein GlcG
MFMSTFKTRPVLTVAEVETVATAARAEASRNGWAVSIAIVDEGGHPLHLYRLDGAAPVSAYIALEKARSAALGRRETVGYEQMINAGRVAFLSTAAITGMLEGGVPVSLDGQCVGAIGVSGVKPNEDAQVARAGAGTLLNPMSVTTTTQHT